MIKKFIILFVAIFFLPSITLATEPLSFKDNGHYSSGLKDTKQRLEKRLAKLKALQAEGPAEIKLNIIRPDLLTETEIDNFFAFITAEGLLPLWRQQFAPNDDDPRAVFAILARHFRYHGLPFGALTEVRQALLAFAKAFHRETTSEDTPFNEEEFGLPAERIALNFGNAGISSFVNHLPLTVIFPSKNQGEEEILPRIGFIDIDKSSDILILRSSFGIIPLSLENLYRLLRFNLSFLAKDNPFEETWRNFTADSSFSFDITSGHLSWPTATDPVNETFLQIFIPPSRRHDSPLVAEDSNFHRRNLALYQMFTAPDSFDLERLTSPNPEYIYADRATSFANIGATTEMCNRIARYIQWPLMPKVFADDPSSPNWSSRVGIVLRQLSALNERLEPIAIGLRDENGQEIYKGANRRREMSIDFANFSWLAESFPQVVFVPVSWKKLEFGAPNFIIGVLDIEPYNGLVSLYTELGNIALPLPLLQELVRFNKQFLEKLVQLDKINQVNFINKWEILFFPPQGEVSSTKPPATTDFLVFTLEPSPHPTFSLPASYRERGHVYLQLPRENSSLLARNGEKKYDKLELAVVNLLLDFNTQPLVEQKEALGHSQRLRAALTRVWKNLRPRFQDNFKGIFLLPQIISLTLRLQREEAQLAQSISAVDNAINRINRRLDPAFNLADHGPYAANTPVEVYLGSIAKAKKEDSFLLIFNAASNSWSIVKNIENPAVQKPTVFSITEDEVKNLLPQSEFLSEELAIPWLTEIANPTSPVERQKSGPLSRLKELAFNNKLLKKLKP